MLESYHKVHCSYNDLGSFDHFDTNQIFLTVIKDNMPFEFLINLKEESEKLIILGSGAYNPDKMSPPIFHRYSWKDEFDCSTIYYNDPTLYLGKMNLGWGYGTSEEHYIETIGIILKEITEKLHFKNENILFYGSSGGGFKSMMLATLLKGSRAFVNNPQTIITNYFKRHVSALYEAVYPNTSDDMSSFLAHRVNTVEFFKRNSHVPTIYYAQNLSCKDDVDNHLIPFIKGISTINQEIFNKITMHYYHNVSEGHNPLDKETTLSIIRNLLKE